MLNFELLGLLYASGTIRWGKNYPIELQTKRKELAKISYALLSQIGKAEIRKNKTLIVSLSGKSEIEKFVNGVGIDFPIDKEKIPSRILGTSEKRKSFLRGFFEGKSSIIPKKRLIKVSGKEVQLKEIKNLLEKEGVISRIYSAGKYKSLYIEGKGRCESFRKIGFLTKEKNDMLGTIAFFEKAEGRKEIGESSSI